MAISVNHETRVIYVPQADLTELGGNLYELNINTFRLWLKDWEDSEEGIDMPDTHRHNTEVSLGGVTIARTVEIINGYTITFENGVYGIRLVGANSNIADVTNINSVSVRTSNSAGLTSPSTPEEIAAAIMAAAVEGSLDFQETVRLMAATLLGKVSGAGTTEITFRDTSDTKDRVVATVDDVGNRSAVTLDGS